MIRKALWFSNRDKMRIIKKIEERSQIFFLRLFTRKQYVLITDPINMNWQYKQNHVHASLSKVYGSPEICLAHA